MQMFSLMDRAQQSPATGALLTRTLELMTAAPAMDIAKARTVALVCEQLARMRSSPSQQELDVAGDMRARLKGCWEYVRGALPQAERRACDSLLLGVAESSVIVLD